MITMKNNLPWPTKPIGKISTIKSGNANKHVVSKRACLVLFLFEMILQISILTVPVDGQNDNNGCFGSRTSVAGPERGGAAGVPCRGGQESLRRNPIMIPIPLTNGNIRSIDASAEDERAQAGATLRRLTPNAYPDGGLGEMIVEGPNPRMISNTVATILNGNGQSNNDNLQRNEDEDAHHASDMLWVWGQFIDHDIDLTEAVAESMAIISPDCNNDVICMIPFHRSEYSNIHGPREQINRITGFLDASMVYGSDEERAHALRQFRGGRLRVGNGNMLPYNVDGLDNAALAGVDPTTMCLAGDVRANEQVGLTAMHTLFVREHNRIVGKLARRYIESTDEQLYQMGRKIVGAEIQAITYKEFLPMLLGPMYAPRLEDYDGYNPDINPAIATEFSTAAFRVGHTLLSPTLLMMHEDEPGSMSLVDAFFNPGLIMDTPINMDYLMAGFCHQNAQHVDTHIVDEVRNFLFGAPVAGVGMDLASINIQRGRDHGLPKYNALRAGLGLSVATSFSDISSNLVVQQALSTAYDGDIDMIDPWIGGLAEDHVAGGMVGELFATIIGDQFYRLMVGDPFFFLNDEDLKDTLLRNGVIDVFNIKLSHILAANMDGFPFDREADVFITTELPP